MSILISFGKYGGFNFVRNADAVRICLGWMAVIVFWYDAEDALESVLKERKKKDATHAYADRVINGSARHTCTLHEGKAAKGECICGKCREPMEVDH